MRSVSDSVFPACDGLTPEETWARWESSWVPPECPLGQWGKTWETAGRNLVRSVRDSVFPVQDGLTPPETLGW